MLEILICWHIFNEIIIIKICILDKYTNVEINSRKKEPQISLVKYNENPDTSFDGDNMSDKPAGRPLKIRKIPYNLFFIKVILI